MKLVVAHIPNKYRVSQPEGGRVDLYFILVDCVRQVFQKSFAYVHSLEALEICISYMIE